MTLICKKLHRVNVWVIVITLTGSLGFMVESTRTPVFAFLSPAVAGLYPVASAETGADQDTDIRWFRDQMGISEQYTEVQEGIFGMSWAHFFTMVFLIVFALGALALYIQRQRRTREILELIRKEMEDGNSDRV